jgi:hypothetical protein
MATELPFELATRIDKLGEPLAVHSVRSGWRLAGELIWSWELLGTLMFVVFALLDPAGWFGLLGMKLPALVLMFGVATVRLVPRLRRSRDLRLLVYPTGLLRVQGETVAAFPWDEVTELRQYLVTMQPVKLQREGEAADPVTAWLPVSKGVTHRWLMGRTRPVVLRDAAGRELTLEPLVTDFPELLQRAQQETFRRLWPDLRDRFDRGEPVYFEGLRLDRRGLRGPKELLPWPDLHEAVVKQGFLVITRKRRLFEWLRKPAHELPNLHALLALIDRAVSKINHKGTTVAQRATKEE